jgi:hypothetical protein
MGWNASHLRLRAQGNTLNGCLLYGSRRRARIRRLGAFPARHVHDELGKLVCVAGTFGEPRNFPIRHTETIRSIACCPAKDALAANE